MSLFSSWGFCGAQCCGVVPQLRSFTWVWPTAFQIQKDLHCSAMNHRDSLWHLHWQLWETCWKSPGYTNIFKLPHAASHFYWDLLKVGYTPSFRLFCVTQVCCVVCTALTNDWADGMLIAALLNWPILVFFCCYSCNLFVYSPFLFDHTFYLLLLSSEFCCLRLALQCLCASPCTVRPNPQLRTVPNNAVKIHYISIVLVLIWPHPKEVLLLFLSSYLA